jgi:hypothetical protein
MCNKSLYQGKKEKHTIDGFFLQMSTRLEDLPNELLFSIFEYMDVVDLYHGFWGLNQRFGQLLQVLKNLSLTIEKDESKLISLFGHRIVRLVIDTSLDVDFSQFPYVHSLILNQMTRNHLQQIQSKRLPHLTYLSTPEDDHYFILSQLIQRIFSTELTSVHYVNLRRLYMSILQGYQSYSLHSITFYCTNLIMIQDILNSSPNLSTLNVLIDTNWFNLFTRVPSIINHPLKYFILIDPYSILSTNNIDTLLVCMPNLQRIKLHFNCDIPFIHFARSLVKQLPYLNRFNCHIEEEPNDDTANIEILREIHPSFYRLRYITDEYGYRTYTTD